MPNRPIISVFSDIFPGAVAKKERYPGAARVSLRRRVAASATAPPPGRPPPALIIALLPLLVV